MYYGLNWHRRPRSCSQRSSGAERPAGGRCRRPWCPKSPPGEKKEQGPRGIISAFSHIVKLYVGAGGGWAVVGDDHREPWLCELFKVFRGSKASVPITWITLFQKSFYVASKSIKKLRRLGVKKVSACGRASAIMSSAGTQFMLWDNIEAGGVELGALYTFCFLTLCLCIPTLMMMMTIAELTLRHCW